MTAYPAGERPDQPPDGVTISRFRHKRDTTPRRERRPWDDLTRLLSRHAVRREKDGPLWSPVVFRPGTERAAANVEAVTELVYDVDHIPPDRNLLDGVALVAYTTSSGEPLVLWRDAGPRCPGCVPGRRLVGTWLTSRAGEPPRLAWTAGVGGPSGREAA
jgi:hypothetical protein